MGCNYLFLPEIPASGNKVHIWFPLWVHRCVSRLLFLETLVTYCTFKWFYSSVDARINKYHGCCVGRQSYHTLYIRMVFLWYRYEEYHYAAGCGETLPHTEIISWYQKFVLIFWYQKFDFLISEITFWYQKFRFSDIRKQFLISENRIFDIGKSVSDIRKSAFEALYLAFYSMGHFPSVGYT